MPETDSWWGLGSLGFHANGGQASGWSIVGEEGAELVNFTSPARVYTASETRAALDGGSSTKVTVNLINNSGTQMQASASEPKMDDLGNTFIDVFLDAVTRNKRGSKDILRGALQNA